MIKGLKPPVYRTIITALLIGFSPSPASAQHGNQAILEAVDSPLRTDNDKEHDAARMPVQTFDFYGLKPGDDVAEILADREGYYTRLMAAVVGPEGSVTAFTVPPILENATSLAMWAETIANMGNISLKITDFAGFAAKENSFDFALMQQYYHDAYVTDELFRLRETEPREFLQVLFQAMRPGGIVAVSDHVGPVGNPRDIAQTIHRIHPDVLKGDFAAVGFVLEAESDLLSSDSDDPETSVFDPSVRGKTDRVMYRFRKPVE